MTHIAPFIIAKLHDTAIDPSDHRTQLHALPNTGAVVEFSGQVRATGDLTDVIALEVDYYTPLTLPALKQLCARAATQWSIHGLCLFHRVGPIALGETIVWVGVASSHRAAAFSAASFVMDRLKTDVPFWKKEMTANGQAHWVKQKQSDRIASAEHDETTHTIHPASPTERYEAPPG